MHRHRAPLPRVPRRGAHSDQVAELVSRLHAQGYRGGCSIEVFNDDYQQIPLPDVVRLARKAADWLGEGILRRSVPLPGAMRLQAVGRVRRGPSPVQGDAGL